MAELSMAVPVSLDQRVLEEAAHRIRIAEGLSEVRQEQLLEVAGELTEARAAREKAEVANATLVAALDEAQRQLREAEERRVWADGRRLEAEKDAGALRRKLEVLTEAFDRLCDTDRAKFFLLRQYEKQIRGLGAEPVEYIAGGGLCRATWDGEECCLSAGHDTTEGHVALSYRGAVRARWRPIATGAVEHLARLAEADRG